MIDPNGHVLEHVDAYLHDALSRQDEDRVVAHCELCPICRVALEEARKRQEALQALPPVEASEALIQKTIRRVERYRDWRPRWIGGGLAAAAVVAIVLGAFQLHYYRLVPTPYDLRVMGQADLLAGANASIRVVLTGHDRPITRSGVPVEIDLIGSDPQTDIHLASFTTDESGTGSVRMQLPDWKPGEYKLRVRAQPDGQTESVEKTVTLHRSWQLMLASDKPIYQPGQVIHLRSLALAKPQSKPVAGQELVFSVTDPKGNVIFRKRDVTSRFGISSADCPLATEILEGPYQVRAELGDTTSAVTVDVRKYVLPKFKIALDLDAPYYQPGQKVRGTLSARYFFGKPLVESNVEIEVLATDVTPTRIAQTTASTDSQGKASFQFVLPQSLVGRPQDQGNARFTVTATVSDTAGQKQSATISRIVARELIHIDVIPEAGTLVPGLPNIVYFLTTYPDGRPAPATLVVSGIKEEIKTNDLGAASVEFNPASGPLTWVVRATDAAGRTGRQDLLLTLDRPSSPGYLLRTDKAVYDGGQTIHIEVLGGGTEPLFLDVLKDGQTVLTETIAMAKGRGEYQIDLPSQSSGRFELRGYRYGPPGLRDMQSRMIYVRPAESLKIDARLDHAEYRPGQQAKLLFTVTGRDGKPVLSALGLAAVDEAVYSVLGATSGMHAVFAGLEDELLKPVYAIYSASPELGSTLPVAERERFEGALLAQAGRQADSRNARLAHTLKYLDVGFEEHDVPDWQEPAPRSPREAKPGLPDRGMPSVRPFGGSSYPEKLRKIDSVRSRRLEQIGQLWRIFVISASVIGLLGLCVMFPRFRWTMFAIGGLSVFLGLLLFGLSFIRNMAPRYECADDVAVDTWSDNAKSTEAKKAEFPRESWHRGDTDHKVPVAPRAVAASLGENDEAAPPARVREWFPETLLWRPELITDDQGKASMTLDLADSITTWRLLANAISAEGKLGALEQPIRVFQPFFVDLNLPVALTRGDEVAVPAVVYNYLDKPLTVELRLAEATWCEPLDSPTQKLELAAGEVRSIRYRLRARQVGQQELTVHASGGGVSDAIKRAIEIVPDGRRVEQVASGALQQPAEIAWSVPEQAIEGSVKAHLKLYPSTFSQLVEGLDGIFQRPYGCFEQTSSTTYPNVLALDYLRRTKKSVPQVEATASQYIHLGYQRLLSFEIAGGGFDWFGQPPAKLTLTAYGLMEFVDMAKVHDVDPKLIERTRAWLLGRQAADGSWTPEGHMLHEDPIRGRQDFQRLGTTAYIAWSAFRGGNVDAYRAGRAMDYLLRYEPATIDDPYTLALVTNAILAIRPDGPLAQPYLVRLEAMSHRSPDGKLAWWASDTGRHTMFYGAGQSGNVETTAMAILAMLEAKTNPGMVRAALAWLIAQKDSRGTWHSTQATVLALKALLAGTERALGEPRERQIDVLLDGKPLQTVLIPADQGEVMQQISLSPHVMHGSHRLTVTDRTEAATGYQATLVYHVPGADRSEKTDPLAIAIKYDKTTLAVDDTVTATVTVTNRMAAAAPMVILDLPIPAGFALDPSALDLLCEQGKIAKYQVTSRSAIVYLRELGPSGSLELTYRLRATMPVKVLAAPARAYEYYNPDHRAATPSTPLTVAAAKPRM